MPSRPLRDRLSSSLLAAHQIGGTDTTPASLKVPTLAHAEAHAVGDPRYAGIAIDAESGEVLYSEDADRRRHPASLAKMMTLYMAFEEIEAGRLPHNQMLRVSRHAARQPPSKLGVKAGSSIRVDDAIKALAEHSSNDVAVVMAEAIAGSESAFARRMTAKARALGLRSTVFTNASGLPDSRMVTTARDIINRGQILRYPHHIFDYYSNL